MPALDPADVLIELWRDAGLDDDVLDDVVFTGTEPVLPSSFAVGTAAQATIGAAGLAAAELWRPRGCSCEWNAWIRPFNERRG